MALTIDDICGPSWPNLRPLARQVVVNYDALPAPAERIAQARRDLIDGVFRAHVLCCEAADYARYTRRHDPHVIDLVRVCAEHGDRLVRLRVTTTYGDGLVRIEVAEAIGGDDG